MAQKVYQECKTRETLGDFRDSLYKHRKQLIIYLASHPRPLEDLRNKESNGDAFLDAGERHSGCKYHNGRAALRTTGLRMASARMGQGKDTARTAEVWKEVAGKVQASPTPGRSIRAREMAVFEVILREERRGPVSGSSDGGWQACMLSLGLGGNSMGTYRWWAGTSGDVTLCHISGLGRRINPGSI
ncbi:hypothetical protein K438DRAFT_1765784 [Mycena galopus ATCC 62051]|nr:hypothetical protein K438DRAFT_1765784 [Mycena galopus ATCC 62051]